MSVQTVSPTLLGDIDARDTSSLTDTLVNVDKQVSSTIGDIGT